MASLGFDMSAMKEEVYGEAIVDVVRPETLVSNPVMIKVRESGSKTENIPNHHRTPFTNRLPVFLVLRV